MSETKDDTLNIPAAPTMANTTKMYIAVAVVAAAVSATTVTYILWRRGWHLKPQAQTVQEMLDRCHDQVRDIEEHLRDLRANPQLLI